MVKRVVRRTIRRTVRRKITIIRRRRFARRAPRRLTGITNRASGASSIGRFRTRRIPRYVYRRMLWRDTVGKPHFRSLSSFTVPAVATPNDIITANIFQAQPGSLFWTVAGGAQPIDTATAVPFFAGDIVLRGGVSTISITNRVNPTDTQPSDPVRVTIFTVWTTRNPQAFTLPTAAPVIWDPSVFPDFSRLGRVIGKREAILKGDGDCVEVFYRHRIQKIDQNVYINSGSRLRFIFMVSQTSNTEAVPAPENLDVVVSHSYSFSADAT